jgi:hypothetical protein
MPPTPLALTYSIDPGIIAALIALLGAVVVFLWGQVLEQRSLNRALIAEISRLVHVVRLHRDWWEKRVHEKDTDYPLIPFSHAVYSKQVKNIGALSESVVERAVKFYGYLDFINSLQAARPDYGQRKPGLFDEQYLTALNNCLDQFENAFDEEFKRLEGH